MGVSLEERAASRLATQLRTILDDGKLKRFSAAELESQVRVILRLRVTAERRPFSAK